MPTMRLQFPGGVTMRLRGVITSTRARSSGRQAHGGCCGRCSPALHDATLARNPSGCQAVD